MLYLLFETVALLILGIMLTNEAIQMGDHNIFTSMADHEITYDLTDEKPISYAHCLT